MINSELYRILGTSLGASYGASFESNPNSFASACLAATGGLIGYTVVQMTLKTIDVVNRMLLKNQENREITPILCKRCLMDPKLRLMITANGEPTSSMAIVPIETAVDIKINQFRPHDLIGDSPAVNVPERSLTPDDDAISLDYNFTILDGEADCVESSSEDSISVIDEEDNFSEEVEEEGEQDTENRFPSDFQSSSPVFEAATPPQNNHLALGWK